MIKKIKILSLCCIMSLALAMPMNVFATEPETIETTTESEEETTEEVDEDTEENSEETSEETTDETSEETSEEGATPSDAEVIEEETTEVTTETTTELPEEIAPPTRIDMYYVDVKANVTNLEEYQQAKTELGLDDEHFQVVVHLTPVVANGQKIVTLELSSSNGFTGLEKVVEGEYILTSDSQTSNIKLLELDEKIVIDKDSEISIDIEYVIPDIDDIEEKPNFWLNLLKNNIVFIILLLGCGVALLICDYRKKNMK